MQDTLKHQFEQIFTKHYERLTNTAQAVGGLSFTLENIVCFILFGGRELDIEDIYGDVSERYSLDTFLADAREAGMETDDHLKKAIADLVAGKFLHLQPDGCYYSYQATRETARMLNRIYPKMQGMSMLAYIGQTLQEAASGRTDMESALSRFDQTLQKQGVPLPKAKIPVIASQPKPAAPPKKAEELKSGNTRIIRDYVVTSAVKAKIDRPQTAPDFDDEAQEVSDASPQEQTVPDLDETDAFFSGNSLAQAKSPQAASEVHSGKAAGIEEAVADDDIAARIAAFEKQLSLVCPICKANSLKEEKTAAGKLFYSCASPSCNFISWGRPHLMACPRCKNAFMVEVEDNAGKLFLKCPRATCQHRQPLLPVGAPPAGSSAGPPAGAPAPPAGGVRTVVRKRLVRRKV